MAKLLEHEIFAEILGNEINKNSLRLIGHSNGTGLGSYADSTEYIIRHIDYCDGEEYIEKFRLTEAIKERWAKNSIEFNIYIYLKDDKIIGGHIYKYKETVSDNHFRPSGYEMEPTQQEIRITKRILEYIAK